MLDEQPKKKSLSEIGHLFLSSVRENTAAGPGGLPRPRRVPPAATAGLVNPGSGDPEAGGADDSDAARQSRGETETPRNAAPNVSLDLTPEEFARAFGGQAGGPDRPVDRFEKELMNNLLDTPRISPAEPERPEIAPVSVLLAHHFGERSGERARRYARHLASDGSRVGLIEADDSGWRVSCFDVGDTGDESSGQASPLVVTSAAAAGWALQELAWDVEHWLLLAAAPAAGAATAALRQSDQWVLLCTCDHDAVVSGYRSIKGLVIEPRPKLSLALLDAAEPTEAAKVHKKIASVCEQFLHWPVSAEPTVGPGDGVVENAVLVADLKTLGAAASWTVLEEFVRSARSPGGGESSVGAAAVEHTPPPASKPAVQSIVSITEAMMHTTSTSAATCGSTETAKRWSTDVVLPPAGSSAPSSAASSTCISFTETPGPVVPAVASAAPVAPLTKVMAANAASSQSLADTTEVVSEVAEMAAGQTTEAAVLAAVLGKPNAGLVACPVRPPSCPEAMLAVDRDRRLVLLAVARQGLAELKPIGQAMRWVTENRPLLSMALPQFAVNPDAAPALRLLVDHNDAAADGLEPIVAAGNVTVQTYRKIRWGGRIGLLLEAA